MMQTRNIFYAFVRVALLFLVCFPLASCKTIERKPDESEYSYGARKLYEEALDELDGGYYQDAIKQFGEVVTKYPLSQYAQLAELKIADAYFEQSDYLHAIDSYDQFVKLHPKHPQIFYALYRIGLSYYEDSPKGWFLFPPAYENDQTPVKNAVIAFRRFVVKYADQVAAESGADTIQQRTDESDAIKSACSKIDNDMIKDACAKIAECRSMLAENEYYVARFYAHRGETKAAIARLETLEKSYPDFSKLDEALFMLGEKYLEIGEKEKAKGAFMRVTKLIPQSSLSAKAEEKAKNIGTP